jgi:hypothetical protein
VLTAVREVQIPLIAALLLIGCATKVFRAFRTGSVDAGLGPTALVPMRLRGPLAVTMWVVEFGLGAGLIVTASDRGAPATGVRVGAGLLFLVATSVLLELRAARPDIGCGCFGDFSTAPVSGRTLARSALLAVAAMSTINARIHAPITSRSALQSLAILGAELVILGALSPELGEGLVRLGYSEPCELRDVPADRTVAALRRSKSWRRLCGLATSEIPADIWRELCWRYVVYPSVYQDRNAELVFAVFLRQRRPAIHAALVDAATGEPLPLLAIQPARRWAGPISFLPLARLATKVTAAHPDMPFSSDL